jgi:hypothetical protein
MGQASYATHPFLSAFRSTNKQLIMKQAVQPNQIRLIVLVLFILVIATSRVLLAANEVTPLSNFSAIGAMALFGGAYFGRIRAFAFPILALWIGDIFLNKLYMGEWALFYEGFGWTYGAFALMVLVGYLFLKEKRTVTNFLGASLVVVLLHWIITDFGVWVGGTMYPKTLSGFWACLVAAIPFERNLLLGTLVYGTLMFGAFEWFKVRFPALRTQV